MAIVLTRRETKPSEGWHRATIASVQLERSVKVYWGRADRLRISFQIGSGQYLVARYIADLSETSELGRFVIATCGELPDKFDAMSLVGVRCRIRVEHKKRRKGGTWAHVAEAKALEEGIWEEDDAGDLFEDEVSDDTEDDNSATEGFRALFSEDDDGFLIPEGWYDGRISASMLERHPGKGFKRERLWLRCELDGISKPLIAVYNGDPGVLGNEELMELAHDLGVTFTKSSDYRLLAGISCRVRVEHAKPPCGQVWACIEDAYRLDEGDPFEGNTGELFEDDA